LILGDALHSGGAVFVGTGYFDAVVELDSFDDFWQLVSPF